MKTFFSGFLVAVLFTLIFSNYSYSQRTYSTDSSFNTTVEYCTGTWCQWCPCGHDVIENILITFPDVVVLAYHGAGSDPWQSYSLAIRQLFGFTGYPTGVVGRRSGVISRNAWNNQEVIQQASINPKVRIDAEINYDNSTRNVSLDLDVTALEDLDGTYRVNLVLLESGMVYPQTGNGSCPGSSNYVHDHVCKGLINGATGEVIHTSGTWTTGTVKNVTTNYTLANDVVPENSDIAIFVWKEFGSISTQSDIINSISIPVDEPTGIIGTNGTVPTEYNLSQNFPNPFNPTTNIIFSVPVDGNVSLKFYDALGNEISSYLDGFLKAGTYNAQFEGADLPSGVYFYTLNAEGFSMTKKMMLIK